MGRHSFNFIDIGYYRIQSEFITIEMNTEYCEELDIDYFSKYIL